MATDLGELIYTLTLNDEGFTGQLDKATNQVKQSSGQISSSTEEATEKTGALGGAFQSMAGQFVVGAAVFTVGQKVLSGMKGAIDDAIQSAKDWQTQQAGLQSELKSTHDASGMSAKGITELAEGIQSTTPISREAALTGDNMLLTFTNLHKDVFPAASQAVADMATRMNGGLVPSAQQMNQTALQLGKALNDPAQGLMMLRRVGVTFSDQQKEQIKSMEKAGDTAGAQKIMLAELNKEFGGSAAANMKTYQGQLDNLRNRFNDIAGKAIQALLKALEKVGAFLLEHKAILAVVAGAITGLAIAIGVALVTALWAVVAPAVAAALAMWPIIAIGAAIGLLAYEIVTHWKDLKQWFDDFWNFLKGIFNDVVSFVKKDWDILLAIILGPVGIAILIWHRFHDEITGIFMDAVHFIENVWNSIVGFFEHIINSVTSAIKNGVSGFGSMLFNAGKDLINGLIHGIENMAGAVTDKIKNVAKGIEDTAKKILKIFSPSQVFSDIGANVSLGLAQGITGTADQAVKATSDLTNNVVATGSATQLPGMTNNSSSSSSSVVYQIDRVVLSTASAVNEFFNIGNRNTQLELAGGSPLAGTAGV